MPLNLPIRAEAPLGPADLVIRGGVMQYESVFASARTCFKKYGVWAISVCALPGGTVADIWAATDNLSIYGNYLVTSVQDLVGYELVPTGRSPHYSLILPGELTPDEHASLIGVFTGPHPAPQ